MLALADLCVALTVLYLALTVLCVPCSTLGSTMPSILAMAVAVAGWPPVIAKRERECVRV